MQDHAAPDTLVPQKALRTYTVFHSALLWARVTG